MYTIRRRSVNEMLPELCREVTSRGSVQNSRAGKVISLDEPILFEYMNPMKRVLMHQGRRENPFFHLFESLWMLSGRNDVAFLTQFNSTMADYSDDGKTFHGAYGFRWRRHWKTDQMLAVAKRLKEDPGTRRAVIGMFDPGVDFIDSKDIPCNTHIYFRRVGPEHEKLQMTVCNRSNDLIWGACGANVVHFSVLHEWMAAAVGCEMSSYFHFTNNLHIYERHWNLASILSRRCLDSDLYTDPYRWLPATKIVDLPADQFLEEVRVFVEDGDSVMNYKSVFLRTVAIPMLKMWRTKEAPPELPKTDWFMAAQNYFVEKEQYLAEKRALESRRPGP